MLKYGDIHGVAYSYEDGSSSGKSRLFINVIGRSVELNLYGDLEMKRLIVSIVLAIALLTSGAVVTQSSLVGTAYAGNASGGGD